MLAMKILEVTTHILGKQVSAIILFDRALVSSYRLSIVTMLLTEAILTQFAMQVFGGAVSTPFGRKEKSCSGTGLVP